MGNLGVSEAELAGLSPEERAALADEDEAGTLNEVVDETDDDAEDEDESKGDGKTESAATGDDADDADDDAEDESKGDKPGAEAAAEADDDDEPFVPRYVAPPVEDYDEQVKALSAQRVEALAAFKRGDLEAEALDAKIEEIETARRNLDNQKQKAELSAEMSEQSAKQQWQWEINRFMRNAAREGVEYRVTAAQAALEDAKKANDAAAIKQASEAVRSARVLNAALDAEVKALAEDPANAERSSEWFLEEAHRSIKARFNLGKPSGERPRTASRKPDLRSIPTTLSTIPAAGSDDTSTGDDGFQHLKGLEGIELENAVARMSKADQERWLRSDAA